MLKFLFVLFRNNGYSYAFIAEVLTYPLKSRRIIITPINRSPKERIIMDVDPLQARRNHTAIDNKQILVGGHTPTGCLFIYNESCNKLYRGGSISCTADYIPKTHPRNKNFLLLGCKLSMEQFMPLSEILKTYFVLCELLIKYKCNRIFLSCTFPTDVTRVLFAGCCLQFMVSLWHSS